MVKQAAPELAATTNEQRNAALAAVRTALQQHQEEIFEANRQDMEQAEALLQEKEEEEEVQVEIPETEEIGTSMGDLLKNFKFQ